MRQWSDGPTLTTQYVCTKTFQGPFKHKIYQQAHLQKRSITADNSTIIPKIPSYPEHHTGHDMRQGKGMLFKEESKKCWTPRSCGVGYKECHGWLRFNFDHQSSLTCTQNIFAFRNIYVGGKNNQGYWGAPFVSDTQTKQKNKAKYSRNEPLFFERRKNEKGYESGRKKRHLKPNCTWRVALPIELLRQAAHRSTFLGAIFTQF